MFLAEFTLCNLTHRTPNSFAYFLFPCVRPFFPLLLRTLFLFPLLLPTLLSCPLDFLGVQGLPLLATLPPPLQFTLPKFCFPSLHTQWPCPSALFPS